MRCIQNSHLPAQKTCRVRPTKEGGRTPTLAATKEGAASLLGGPNADPGRDQGGSGQPPGRTETYRGHEYTVDLIPKVRIEIAAEDNAVDRIIDAIVKGAKSGAEGKVGDGKIFVTPLEEVVRIRTGEVGEAAI